MDKVTCLYACSELTDKKLKFVKLSLETNSCDSFLVAINTIIGSGSVSALPGGSGPSGSSGIVFGRKVFTTDRSPYSGECGPFNPNATSTSSDLAAMATYNIIGGYDIVHTVIDVENINVNSHQNPEMDWWYLPCRDTINGSGNYGGPENCILYFNIDSLTGNIDYNNPTALGEEKLCIKKDELNSILSVTEVYCKQVASAANKQFIHLDADWTGTLCYSENHHWEGTLTIGKKIYRDLEPLELAVELCNCE